MKKDRKSLLSVCILLVGFLNNCSVGVNSNLNSANEDNLLFVNNRASCYLAELDTLRRIYLFEDTDVGTRVTYKLLDSILYFIDLDGINEMIADPWTVTDTLDTISLKLLLRRYELFPVKLMDISNLATIKLYEFESDTFIFDEFFSDNIQVNKTRIVMEFDIHTIMEDTIYTQRGANELKLSCRYYHSKSAVIFVGDFLINYSLNFESYSKRKYFSVHNTR